jgi:hypothetical protein
MLAKYRCRMSGPRSHDDLFDARQYLSAADQFLAEGVALNTFSLSLEQQNCCYQVVVKGDHQIRIRSAAAVQASVNKNVRP